MRVRARKTNALKRPELLSTEAIWRMTATIATEAKVPRKKTSISSSHIVNELEAKPTACNKVNTVDIQPHTELGIGIE